MLEGVFLFVAELAIGKDGDVGAPISQEQGKVGEVRHLAFDAEDADGLWDSQPWQ